MFVCIDPINVETTYLIVWTLRDHIRSWSWVIAGQKSLVEIIKFPFKLFHFNLVISNLTNFKILNWFRNQLKTQDNPNLSHQLRLTPTFLNSLGWPQPFSPASSGWPQPFSPVQVDPNPPQNLRLPQTFSSAQVNPNPSHQLRLTPTRLTCRVCTESSLQSHGYTGIQNCRNISKNTSFIYFFFRNIYVIR